MSQPAGTSTKPLTGSRLPLRFSLRVLLLAVTAFAIGFPVWYRWPYEEVEYSRITTGPGPSTARRVKTWQRQWGGGRLQHGEEQFYLREKLVEVQTYRDGKLHGPFRQFNQPENFVFLDGYYDQGLKGGAWRFLDAKGQEISRSEYLAGKLVRSVHVDQNGKQQIIEFRNVLGKPTIVAGGIEIEDRLARLAAEGRIDDARLRESLRMPVDFTFAPGPLEDFVLFMSDVAETPIFLDPHHAKSNRAVSGACNELPLSIALSEFTRLHGHACDYRYGAIWITSPADAKDWHDPTGVAKIEPPQDSQLARSWNESAAIVAQELPLVDALRQLVQPLAVDVDVSAIDSSELLPRKHVVTMTRYGHPFRHVLGILLYNARCRCELRGETLVILPP